MAINLSDKDEERLFMLFWRIMDLYDNAKINSTSAMAVCGHIARLAAKDDEIALRELMNEPKSLGMFICRITRMPAPRRKVIK